MIKKIAVAAMVAVLAMVLCSCGSSEPADSSQPSQQASGSGSGGTEDVYAEISAFSDSEAFVESSALISEIGKLDIASLTVKGDYEKFDSYYEKLKACRDKLPEYSGSNERVAQLHELYAGLLDTWVEALRNAKGAASSSKIGDAKSYEKYANDAAASIIEAKKKLDQMNALLALIQDEYGMPKSQ